MRETLSCCSKECTKHVFVTFRRSRRKTDLRRGSCVSLRLVGDLERGDSVLSPCFFRDVAFSAASGKLRCGAVHLRRRVRGARDA